MKKGIGLLSLLLLFLLVGCTNKESIDNQVIKIGASSVPHAEILEFVRPQLEAKGYELEIVLFSDYVLPNLALQNQELDANFFQHVPYLEYFNTENDTNLVSAGIIHFEPLGIYAGISNSLDNVQSGDTIAIPNDATNRARALLLLQAAGLLTLDPEVGLNATVLDITDNPLQIEIIELEAAGIPSRLQDVNFGIINGNYALSSNVEKAVLLQEDAASEAALRYANIIAVREGTESTEAIQILLEVLHTEALKTYITDTYDGLVLPVF